MAQVHSFLLDFDGCAAAIIANTSFSAFSLQGEKVCVDTNNPLFIKLVEIIRTTPPGSKIVIVCFSNRQDARMNFSNSLSNGSISVFDALEAICFVLAKITQRKIILDTKILGDILGIDGSKSIYSETKEYLLTAREENAIWAESIRKLRENSALRLMSIEDKKKRLLLWMIVWRLSFLFPEDFVQAYVFDDFKEAILDEIIKFYDMFFNVFPSKIMMDIYHYRYDNEEQMLNPALLRQIVTPFSPGKYDFNHTYKDILGQCGITIDSSNEVLFFESLKRSLPTVGDILKKEDSYLVSFDWDMSLSECCAQTFEPGIFQTSVMTKSPHNIHTTPKLLMLIKDFEGIDVQHYSEDRKMIIRQVKQFLKYAEALFNVPQKVSTCFKAKQKKILTTFERAYTHSKPLKEDQQQRWSVYHERELFINLDSDLRILGELIYPEYERVFLLGTKDK